MVTSKKVGGVTVVELAGELTALTAGDAQEQVLRLAEPRGRMILDMSRVSFMSSAGLRLLLKLHRTINGQGGKLVLVGLSEDLRDTMSLTGFLDLMEHRDTLEAGFTELASE